MLRFEKPTPAQFMEQAQALREERDRLREELERARREQTSLAVVMLDTDNFKFFNDVYGHATGDALLKAAATRLHQSLRNNDLFGRFSGDEFIVVLRDLAAPEDAGHVARKLIASLAEPMRTVPWSCPCRPARIFSSVDLPQPDGPMKAVTLRSGMSRWMFLSAWNLP